MNERRRLPPDVIIQAEAGLNGEITRNMRMVAMRLDGTEVIFRFYVDREPDEDDLEHADIAALNFEAAHIGSYTKIDLDFVVTGERMTSLDPLDFILFQRYEPE